jgi:predicted aspartyl protease
MITGTVSAFREPLIRLVVQGPTGIQREVEAVVDTGLNGWLTLPAGIIDELELVFRPYGRAVLGDGSETVFRTFDAVVLWDGNPRRVAVDEAECDPLVGMSQLYGSELVMRVVDGGDVIIRPLPAA